jgi:hypothetical protein
MESETVKLIYTKHAEQRLLERSIAKKDVEKALRHPTRIESVVIGDFRVFLKLSDTKELVVAGSVVGTTVTITTSFIKENQ